MRRPKSTTRQANRDRILAQRHRNIRQPGFMGQCPPHAKPHVRADECTEGANQASDNSRVSCEFRNRGA